MNILKNKKCNIKINDNSNIDVLKTKQKEFIEFIQSSIKEFEDEEKYLHKKRIPKFYELGQVKGGLDVLRSVLSKYKEIIGGDNK